LDNGKYDLDRGMNLVLTEPKRRIAVPDHDDDDRRREPAEVRLRARLSNSKVFDSLAPRRAEPWINHDEAWSLRMSGVTT